MEERTFADRKEAGRLLADAVRLLAPVRPLVLGLPRGGVPVALEVAHVLRAPLDTLIVRKVGLPGNPEFGVGAVAPSVLYLDEATIARLGISRSALEGVIAGERAEMERRINVYASGSYSRGFVPGTVIIVDDGIATGVSARAALRSARAKWKDAKIILAAPVCARDTAIVLRTEFDETVFLSEPESLIAIGYWYERFDQVSDAEVRRCLDSARSVSTAGH
jgi:putative phosphoribosyl transferase